MKASKILTVLSAADWLSPQALRQIATPPLVCFLIGSLEGGLLSSQMPLQAYKRQIV